MGTHYSPRTVTDGLVFAFDTGNSKSYKGEPTTNLLAGSTYQNPQNWGPRPVEDKTLTGETYLGLPIWRLEDANGVDPNTYVDNYMTTNFTGLTAGDVYTFSFYFRVIQKPTSNSNDADNSAWIWYVNNSDVIHWVDFDENVWYRAELSGTVNSTYNKAQPRIDYDNSIIDICGLQFEKNTHATPFVDGTRSVTESLFDQTKNTTLDLTNVSFDANAQMTFDGTDDYIDLGNLGLGAGPFTVEAVIYPPLASTYHVFFRKGDDSNSNDGMDWSMGYDYNQFHVRAQNASVAVNEYAGGSFVNSNGYVVLTYNGETIRMYKDGVEVLNKAVTFANNYSNYSIGRGINNFAQLDVKNVKVYNRALSAEEVQQNYNALKGRFGL